MTVYVINYNIYTHVQTHAYELTPYNKLNKVVVVCGAGLVCTCGMTLYLLHSLNQPMIRALVSYLVYL